MAKIGCIKQSHRGRITCIAGTIPMLAKYFAYTLECGNSWNDKIKTADQISTMRSLLSNLDKAVYETQGGCFEQDSYYDGAEFLTPEIVKQVTEKNGTVTFYPKD